MKCVKIDSQNLRDEREVSVVWVGDQSTVHTAYQYFG